MPTPNQNWAENHSPFSAVHSQPPHELIKRWILVVSLTQQLTALLSQDLEYSSFQSGLLDFLLVATEGFGIVAVASLSAIDQKIVETVAVQAAVELQAP